MVVTFGHERDGGLAFDKAAAPFSVDDEPIARRPLRVDDLHRPFVVPADGRDTNGQGGPEHALTGLFQRLATREALAKHLRVKKKLPDRVGWRGDRVGGRELHWRENTGVFSQLSGAWATR